MNIIILLWVRILSIVQDKNKEADISWCIQSLIDMRYNSDFSILSRSMVEPH